MSIKITDPNKAFKMRAYSYYRSARLIIDYCRGDKAYKNICLFALNNHILTFFEVAEILEEDLECFLAKIIGILNYYYCVAMAEEKQLEDIQSDLSHADHLYNWLIREKDEIEPIMSILDTADTDSKPVLQVIERMPISKFNKLTEMEWLKILNSKEEQPGWFTKLPAWEQKVLLTFVEIWDLRESIDHMNYEEWPSGYEKLSYQVKERLEAMLKQKKEEGQLHSLNLGDFLGGQAGHLCRYPSIRNGYRVKICTYVNGKNKSLKLFRKSSVISMGTPYIDVEDENEQVNITICNIQQAIISDLVNSFRKIALLSSDSSVVTIPILIQYFIAHHRSLDDKVICSVVAKAVEKLNNIFSSKKGIGIFLKRNKAQIKDMIEKDTDVDDVEEFLSNIIEKDRVRFTVNLVCHNVIDKSMVSKFSIPFSKEKEERKSLIKVLNKEYTKLIRKSLTVNNVGLSRSKYYTEKVKQLLDNEKPIEAVQEIKQIIDEHDCVVYKNSFLQIGLDAYEIYTMNKASSFELSAYLQIAFSAVGIRIGGCANGHDFEGPFILVVNILRSFYTRYKYFPGQVPLSEVDEKTQIDVYETYLARQFLQGPCHNLLEASSQGCSGVTYLENTLGASVLEKINENGVKYGIKENSYDYYKIGMILSRLESTNDNNDISKHTKTIKNEFVKCEELKFANEELSERDVAIIEIPDEILMKSKGQQEAEKEERLEFESRVKKAFSLDSFDALHKITQVESKTLPSVSTTLERLQKFYDKRYSD